MSLINVTVCPKSLSVEVNSRPINLTVNPYPNLLVSVATAGVQGPAAATGDFVTLAYVSGELEKSTQLFYGSGAPTITPFNLNSAAFYYDIVTYKGYLWNPITQSW